MFKKFLILFLSLMLMSSFVLAAVAKRYRQDATDPSNKTYNQKKVVTSEVGLNIPEFGVAIDTVYNRELTNLIPGLHIINVVVSNKREEPIEFDVSKDKWIIVDSSGKKHKAYNHVSDFSQKTWEALPAKLKHKLSYPARVSPSKSINIDIYLPSKVDLLNFKEVVWKSAHFDKEFNLFTTYEDDIQINSKEFDTPKNSTTINLNDPMPNKYRKLEDQKQYDDQNTKAKPADPKDFNLIIME